MVNATCWLRCKPEEKKALLLKDDAPLDWRGLDQDPGPVDKGSVPVMVEEGSAMEPGVLPVSKDLIVVQWMMLMEKLGMFHC
jgi:hypothetical protein